MGIQVTCGSRRLLNSTRDYKRPGGLNTERMRVRSIARYVAKQVVIVQELY